MADTVLDFTTVICPNHHVTLVNGLWRMYRSQQCTDLNITVSTTTVIRLHKQIVDLFMSTEKLVEYVLFTGAHNLHPLLEFLYTGATTLPRRELSRTLRVARELQFNLLVNSLQSAPSDLSQSQSANIIGVNHERLLIIGLWKTFQAARKTTQKSNRQSGAYLVRLLLSAMELGDIFMISQTPLNPSTFEHITQALFTGTVIIANQEILNVIKLARRLGFAMLLDAIYAARNGIALPAAVEQVEEDCGLRISEVWSCNAELQSDIPVDSTDQMEMDCMVAESDVTTLLPGHTVVSDEETMAEQPFVISNCRSLTLEEGGNDNCISRASNGQTAAMKDIRQNFAQVGKLIAKETHSNPGPVALRDDQELSTNTDKDSESQTDEPMEPASKIATVTHLSIDYSEFGKLISKEASLNPEPVALSDSQALEGDTEEKSDGDNRTDEPTETAVETIATASHNSIDFSKFGKLISKEVSQNPGPVAAPSGSQALEGDTEENQTDKPMEIAIVKTITTASNDSIDFSKFGKLISKEVSQNPGAVAAPSDSQALVGDTEEKSDSEDVTDQPTKTAFETIVTASNDSNDFSKFGKLIPETCQNLGPVAPSDTQVLCEDAEVEIAVPSSGKDTNEIFSESDGDIPVDGQNQQLPQLNTAHQSSEKPEKCADRRRSVKRSASAADCDSIVKRAVRDLSARPLAKRLISNSSTSKKPNKRPFRCSLCWATFWSRSTMGVHFLVHAVTHICAVCQKPFPRSNLLRIHMTTHRSRKRAGKVKSCVSLIDQAGAKSEEESVPQMLNQVSVLNEHVEPMVSLLVPEMKKSHSTVYKYPFACPMCKLTLYKEDLLFKHMYLHSAQKTKRMCDVCRMLFASNDDLQRHMQRQHPSPDPLTPDVSVGK